MAPKGKEVKSEGKYFELEGAVEGEVVVRFPPEASGYLHIGHAKAALLNAHYQQHYKGKLVMRFDDTNPEKEKEAFEKIIEGDVELLNIKPDCLTYSSDYFDLMLEKAEGMIKQSKAYVDDTPAEQMKNEREQRVESKNRNNDVATNLKMWEEMKNGSELGQTYCLRAKVDMKSDNGAMRDPTIYRCKPQEHPRSGLKYKCYPTYDFACPIVDSIEGITHALRTSEYMDRDAQYYWFCDALEIRKPRIAAYSRLSLMNTVLSKRKLTYFVQEGVVTGWDDPRMPTVRGILRRGLTVEGLKQFIAAQGSSKAIVVMEWDKIWAFNRKVIDPQAGRYSAVENLNSVVVDIDGTVPTEPITVALHPKNAEMGTRAVPVGAKLIIDQTDAQLIQPNTTVTFLSWGNLHINEVQKNGDIVTGIKASLDLENRDFKKTLKASWLEKEKNALPARLVYYDNIIRKPVLGKDDDFKQFMNMNSKFSVDAHVDVACKTLKVGDIIQIQRKGFFIVDKAYESAESPIELISIPDGTTDMNIFPKSVQEWKKSNVYVEPEKPKAPAGDAAKLDGEIRAQGEVVRVMKSNGAAKDAVTAEVQKLLALKALYKTAAGKDWKPEAAPAALKQADKPAASAAVALSPEGEKLNSEIKAQGEAVRDLKAKGGSKDAVTAEVQKLLALKAQFKTVTGKDWKPEAAPAAPKQDAKPAAPAAVALSPEGEKLNAEIKAQGEAVRDLKSKGGSKDAVTAEVQKLLALKTQFKEVTGNEWKPEGGAQPRAARQEKPKAPPAPKQAKQPKPAPQKNPQAGDSGKVVKKQTRLGMETSKSDNYSEWYTEVITKAEMIEYYDVSGCYILRPWSYAIWEKIQAFFDAKIKSIGVMNCYFPMFISKSALETEKTHIADFAPEVAWVTKSGQSDLAEPIAIRPTSETVMYPSFGKWIQSYRDLPIQLNQWCNVVRWEFKQPTPFLRTREFLWQEGHSAHGTQEDTMKEVLTILDFYAAIYEELLAIPVVKGKKTEKEKFAGGDMTTTVEAYVDVNGRGIQGATSHYLGQNFSKMFDVSFEDPEKPGEKAYAYQTSWGLSTRTIGALIMIHGDDKGLVLPPNVAAIQSVIVPCGITASTPEDDKKKLVDACHQLAKSLRDGNVKVKVDDGDQHSPGWKFNHWELKGVPIRVELGPKDLAKGEFVAVRRDNGEKISFKLDNAANDVQTLLKSIHENMFARATKVRDDHMTVTESWDTFIEKLEQKFIIMAPFCGEPSCEDRIKDDSKKDDVADASGGPLMGAKSLCIPFAQPKDVAPGTKCIHGACTRAPKYYTLFGRSY